MKNLVVLIIAFSLVFSFSSCSGKKPKETPSLSSESENSEFSETTDTTQLEVELPKCFYEYREGVVKHSSFDTKSNLAANALEFTEKYLEKSYSENPEIESFEITDVEIDIGTTDYQVNILYNGDSFRNEDLLKGFIIVRYRSNIKIFDDIEFPQSFPDSDLSRPIEGHLFLIYDPENIYSYAYELDGFFWKTVNSDIWEWREEVYSEEEIFEKIYARNNVNDFPIHTYIESDSEDTVIAVECMREYLEAGLGNDPAVLRYEIIDIKPDINHTNWYINTVQQTDFSFSTLCSGVICLNVSYVMDIDEDAESPGDFSGPFGDYDNIPVEFNYYLVRNYNKWEVFSGSTYPHNAFDELTDEQIINAINDMH